jgi:ABC-2 type transport system ATP-binding protein
VYDVKQQFKENLFNIQLNTIPANIQSNNFDVLQQKENKLTVKINETSRSNDVLQYFLQRDVTIEGFNEILPSLNDIFIQLVEGTKASRQFQKVV